MSDLKTTYLGIELKNPVIIGASNLVSDLDKSKKIEEAGAAAFVYKSIFEEQIQLENLEMHRHMEDYAERHAEMTSIFPDMEHAGPKEYLLNLENFKKEINVPVFGSINAVSQSSWLDYAKKVEETGVDGLEVNIYSVPCDFNRNPESILAEQIDIVRDVVNEVTIPVSVKLSSYYSNPLYAISEMDKAGAKGFVLFNRLFQPDIDVEKEEHVFNYNLSTDHENKLALRYTGLLHGNISADIIASNGISSGHDVVKMLLAGATGVQVVSTIYKNGTKQVATILDELSAWMKLKGYNSLEDFRGKLSRKSLKDPVTYKRAQYIDILMKSNTIFDKYPVV